MKKNIHPKYYSKAKITCACGNVIETGSTVETMSVEICSACHPFYTGKKKLVDSAGQVDRFKKRLKKSSQLKEKKRAIKAKKIAKKKTGQKKRSEKNKATKKK